MPGRIGFISLGCAKNLVNTEQMMYLLGQAGYQVTGETDGVDMVIVNTCGFIESARAEAIDIVDELAAVKDEGRIGRIIVTGCLPQRYQNDIFPELQKVDAFIGVGSFDEIVGVVRELGKKKDGRHGRGRQAHGMLTGGKQSGGNQSGGNQTGGKQSGGNQTGGNQTGDNDNDAIRRFGDIHAPVSEAGRIITTSPIWTYLKIADGCDNRCAYCSIPDIRGRYRSRPMENIVSEARQLVRMGTRELIIIAQDVTRYGLDLYGEQRLTELLTALDNIDELKWIRLHYLYPDEISDSLIEIITKSDKILNYLDIPIQHINDGILAKMNRRCSGDDIRALFRKLRERIPGVVLRTSLITGLPGEGEAEFAELLEFLSEAKIERAGVFAYSPEEGTAAVLMERPDTDTALSRAAIVEELQEQIMESFNRSRIGTETTVLVEGAVYEADMEANTTETSPCVVKANTTEPSPCVVKPSTPEPSPCVETSPCVLARSYAESPDVDGYIVVRGGEIDTSTFVEVRITGIENGELVGEQILI